MQIEVHVAYFNLNASEKLFQLYLLLVQIHPRSHHHLHALVTIVAALAADLACLFRIQAKFVLNQRHLHEESLNISNILIRQ